jgi:hypothetical protein
VRTLIRLIVMLGGALTMLAIAAIATPVYAAVQPPRFNADSGDSCPYGVTMGTLTWRFSGATATALAVDIEGTVSDQPTPLSPRNCRSDGLNSRASFTAYFGSAVVGSRSATVDNGELPFAFRLGGSGTIGRIDRLVVQVCRFPTTPVGISYCGAPKTYRPVLTW